MTITWSNQLSAITKPPEKISEAIDRLLNVLSPEEKRYISVMDENDLINLHLSLGLSIRNAFSLHDPNSPLLIACKTVHPDDASELIIATLWKTLQS